MVLIAAACNTTTQCAAWHSESDTVAYAAASRVCLVPNATGERPVVRLALPGHTEKINAVRFLSAADAGAPILLATAATDKTVRVWRLSFEEDIAAEVVAVLEGHTDSVTGLVDMVDAHGSRVIVSVAADHTARLWECKKGDDDSQWNCVQTLEFGRHYMLSASLAFLPVSGAVLLTLAGDDMRVRLYTKDASGQFQARLSLPGHEDWIQSLDARPFGDQLLLASGAQDGAIRLWLIEADTCRPGQAQDPFDALLEAAEQRFETWEEKAGADAGFTVRLESLLMGHEGKVFSVRWASPTAGSTVARRQLMSSSADRSVILWEPEEESGVWIEVSRLGKLGGSTLGYFGAIYGPSDEWVLAHGYQGGVHVWRKDGEEWRQHLCPSGHFASVQDLDWEPQGRFLLSVSDDQTARVFAPWRTGTAVRDTWHEIARPQVHGYDMRCVCMAASDGARYVSGADEKVVRVFSAPASFVRTFSRVSLGIDVEADADETGAIGASVPVLGLSNKAVFSRSQPRETNDAPTTAAKGVYKMQEDDVRPVAPSVLNMPPFEEHLVQNTLWPEAHKLYGHGFELLAVACNRARTLMASSCRATQPEHAQILLWDLASGLQVASLPGHKLSVVQLAFSPDDAWLISASRDRQWSLYKKVDAADSAAPYAHLLTMSKAHARIIWALAWAPDTSFFATGSRDKTVKIWGVSGKSNMPFELRHTLAPLKDSITALDVAPRLLGGRFIMAVGLENGNILIFAAEALDTWELIQDLGLASSHTGTVTRLRFQPLANDPPAETAPLLLASCGIDGFVRIHEVIV